jgi:Xaa-Pro dipeptidase
MDRSFPGQAPVCAKDLVFSEKEYRARVARVQESLREKGFDALIALEPESISYLTGFLSPRGYNTFHFAIVQAGEDPILFFRDAEEFHFLCASPFSQRQTWSDGQDIEMQAADTIRRSLGRFARVGFEKFSWQINAKRYDRLRELLPDMTLVDAGNLVRGMRLIKSPAELEYQRRAGKAAECAMDAARSAAKVGAREREIGAAVASAMVRAGSDRAEPGPIASGERALAIHCAFNDRVLRRGDTVQLEMCPHVRNYHARFMRPLKVGHASDEESDLADKLFAIQDRALGEVGPGVLASIPDHVYREGVRATGLTENYTNKTFYSIGLMLYPNGSEFLEATAGASWHFEVGMTFHSYVIVRGFAVSETIVITRTGYERLTNYSRELLLS